MQQCFENIIGYTDTDCACFTGEVGANAAISTSGLYMDGLPETEYILKNLKNTADCGKTMEALFERARSTAIEDFTERVFAEIGTRYTIRNAPYTGLIGKLAFSGPLLVTAPFMGAILEMRPYKGGILTVNAIYTALNQTLSGIPLNVYKAYLTSTGYEVESSVTTIPVNSVANQTAANVLEVPLQLPMYDDQNALIHYLFIYDRSSGFLPLDVSGQCDCGSQANIQKWLIQGGITSATANHYSSSLRKTGKGAPSYGVILNATIACKDTGFVCEAYQNPMIKAATDKAIQYQAASNLLKGILRSDAIDRYALTKREQMSTDAEILHGKFKQRVTWVSENINMTSNTCYVCNNVNDYDGPYKRSILL